MISPRGAASLYQVLMKNTVLAKLNLNRFWKSNTEMK